MRTSDPRTGSGILPAFLPDWLKSANSRDPELEAELEELDEELEDDFGDDPDELEEELEELEEFEELEEVRPGVFWSG